MPTRTEHRDAAEAYLSKAELSLIELTNNGAFKAKDPFQILQFTVQLAIAHAVLAQEDGVCLAGGCKCSQPI